MIVQTITDPYDFYEWMKKSDTYKGKFSLKGALAIQAYYEDMSEATGEPVEFDPVDWCCVFTEYKSVKEAYREFQPDADLMTEREMLEYFQDDTTVLELEGGGIVIVDF